MSLKRKIQIFEEVEGSKLLDLRRWFNLTQIQGGELIGQGAYKCVYNSNEGLGKKIPKLGRNQVNVVLSKDAWKEEVEAKQKIVKLLDPRVMKKILVMLDDKPVCLNLKKPPLPCEADVMTSKPRYVVRAPLGNSSKKFKTRKQFGKAVLNLVYGLFALHTHGLVHGDLKIHPDVMNVVRIKGLFKMIDLGYVMNFKDFKQGLEHPLSSKGIEIHTMRKYEYWPTAYVFYQKYPKDVQRVAEEHSVSLHSIQKVMFEDIDLYGFMKSLRVLIYLNSELKLQDLWTSLQPKLSDFSPKQRIVKRIVAACQVGLEFKRPHDIPEMFLSLPKIYSRIRTICNVSDAPKKIQDYIQLK